MDGRDTKFIFCPRCGGIMEPPVCRVCGYDFRSAYENVNPGQDADLSGNGGESVQNPNAVPQGNAQVPNQPVNKNFQPAEKKKKKFWIPLVIAGSVLLILLILCGPVISVVKTLRAVGKLNNKQSSGTQIQASNPKIQLPSSSGIDDSELEGERIMVKRHYGRDDFSEVDLSFYEGMADISTTTSSGGFDPFINPYVTSYRDSSSVFDYTHTNHYGEQMGPDYYEPFCDYIDASSYKDSYQINRKYYYYDDQMGNIRVQANVAFAELSGNIPNLDQLNQEIFERTASDLFNYLNGSSQYSMYVYETITFSVDSYIVYNDAEKISIVTDCVVHTDDYWMNLDSYIYSINIDLKNGKIIENDEIINIDLKKTKEYREQCLTQNGSNNAWDPLTDEELMEYLNDKETNIVFFNPVGLEIGAAYTYKDDILSRGWATVTLKDGTYENLLKDPALRKKGGRSIFIEDSTEGGWISINPLEAYHESEKLREDFPDYNWLTEEDIKDWNVPDGENGKGTGTGEKPGEDTSEKTSEDTSEKDSEKTSEDDSGSIYDNPLDDPDFISDYEELMDYFENYGKETGDEKKTMTAEEYFRLPRKEPVTK